MRRVGRIIKPTNQEPTVQMRQAVVTAITSPTVIIQLSGDPVDIPGVHRLASYSPTVNDIVWVIKSGGDLLIIGKQA